MLMYFHIDKSNELAVYSAFLTSSRQRLEFFLDVKRALDKKSINEVKIFVSCNDKETLDKAIYDLIQNGYKQLPVEALNRVLIKQIET